MKPTQPHVRTLFVLAAGVAALSGCHAKSTPVAAAGTPAAASPQASSPAATPAPAALPSSYGSSTGTATAAIPDPTLNNIPAIDVTYPAGWQFQGVLVPADECKMLPYVVYRATSPDGLTFVENQPTLHWKFGTGPMGASRPVGCLPIDHPISAREFLQYVANMMHYTWVGDEAVPGSEQHQVQDSLAKTNAQFAAQFRAAGAEPMRQSADLARARVAFTNGSFPMMGQLDGRVICTNQTVGGFHSALAGVASRPDSVLADCGGEVRFTAAPASQYDKITQLMDADGVGYKPEPGWLNAYVQRSNQIAMQNIKTLDQMIQSEENASNQFWQNARAVSNQQHQQFMQGMQDQFNHFQAGQAAQQAQRATFTSDMVDFALDRQTVADPNTGQLSKVSSTYGQTWVDSSGKHSFQTNNVNANPNGYLPGNWTKQTVVHGDGSSY
jgi:hypothetical protein